MGAKAVLALATAAVLLSSVGMAAGAGDGSDDDGWVGLPEYDASTYTDWNWSSNFTAGDLDCNITINGTSGSLTCSWPDTTYSHWGINCTVSAGSFTITWSTSGKTWNWTGGTLDCSWDAGGGSDEEAAAEPMATRVAA